MSRPGRKKMLRVVAVGMLTSIMVTAASYLGYLDFLQRRALDLMVWWKDPQKPSEIIIVAIDEETFSYLGEKQPLPRRYLAALVRLLHRGGAKIVALDIELKTKTEQAADDALEQAIAERTIVPYDVLPSSTEGRVTPTPLFLRDTHIVRGFANTYIDDDGVIRRAPLILQDERGEPIYSFAFMIFKYFTDSMKERDVAAELVPGKVVRINYAGPSGSFPTFPSLPLFHMAESEIEPPMDNPFRDKIVFIGATFKAGRDFFPTPTGFMNGVEIQANIVNTLLTKSAVKPVNAAAGLIIQIFLSMIVGLFFLAFRPLKAAIISMTGILLFFVPLSYLVYAKGNYWVDFVPPVVAVAVASIMHDAGERKKIRQSFSQYVSREIVEEVYRDESALDGQRKTVTILFSDIRGFTALSENIEFDLLVSILNEYLAMMTDLVLKNGGMINKFIGDAVMAIYGAPVERRDHAASAARTAIEMVEGLEILNQRWRERGIPPLRIGIGIHSGEVFAGIIGSEKRKEYTIIGDTVNLASRIEGINKELSTTILVSEETRNLLHGQAEVRDMGVMDIRGRLKPVRLYELTGLHP